MCQLSISVPIKVCLLDFKVLPTENFSSAFSKESTEIDRGGSVEISGREASGAGGGRGGRGGGGGAAAAAAAIASAKPTPRLPRRVGDADSLSTTSSLIFSDDNFHTPVESEDEDEEEEAAMATPAIGRRKGALNNTDLAAALTSSERTVLKSKATRFQQR